jgi:hypothetical protein
MFYDLYNTVYFTVGAWLTCYQHITGTYQKGTGMAGIGDALSILFSYMCVSITILLGTVVFLAVK